MTESPRAPAWLHVLLALFVAAVFALAHWNPHAYEALMQEDRAVEWATVLLFAVAGASFLRRGIRARSAFDVLLALFCLFVAGEEMSWGQRLVGYTPPDVFLEHNAQQEATVHNLAAFGKPKWIFAAALAAYGVLLSVLGATRFPLRALRVTPPPRALVPWFALSVVLLIWYPLEFTGEWVELFAGVLFVASAARERHLAIALPVAVVASAGIAASVDARHAPRALVVCARVETDALTRDLAGGAALEDLLHAEVVEKRLATAVREDYVDAAQLARFGGAPCDRLDRRRARRFGIDPWGTAYWILAEAAGDSVRLSVYSFGPNRRRDLLSSRAGGDDVVSDTVIAP